MAEHVVTQLDVSVVSPGTAIGLVEYAYRCSCGWEGVGNLNGNLYCPRDRESTDETGPSATRASDDPSSGHIGPVRST